MNNDTLGTRLNAREGVLVSLATDVILGSQWQETNMEKLSFHWFRFIEEYLN